MPDPAKANSQQPPHRKKTAPRGKKRGARVQKASTRRKQFKSSQIDLFDDETMTSEKEKPKETFPGPIVGAPEGGAKSASDEKLAAGEQTPMPLEKVVSRPKAPNSSELAREAPKELPKELPKEVVSAPSSQTFSRFSSSSSEVGPRRLLRSQQLRAARLRRSLYIGGGALLLLMIALAVFLLVRGRTRTDVKGVTQSAISDVTPPPMGTGVTHPLSGESSDAELATTGPTSSAVAGDEQESLQPGTQIGVPDSQEHQGELVLDAALAETELAPSSIGDTTPQILPPEQSVLQTGTESSEKTGTIADQSPSETAVDAGTETPSSGEAAESAPASTEVAMAEESEPSFAIASPGLLPEKKMAAPSSSASPENATAIDFASPWTNSLGMKFVPVDDVLFSVWETRVKDFEAFCKSAKRERDRAPFEESGDHPVSRVSWNDAREFCAWLTEKERSEAIIGPDQYYRLPTDLEWSIAAGLEGEVGDTPEARDTGISKNFPWGSQWPPPGGAGNIADRSASSRLKSTVDTYTDGYVRSAPVGSFEANALGIFDLSGNLWEWCQDAYGGKGSLRSWRVMRGGGWSTYQRKELLTSYRNVVNPDSRGLLYGFRCVLARE